MLELHGGCWLQLERVGRSTERILGCVVIAGAFGSIGDAAVFFCVERVEHECARPFDFLVAGRGCFFKRCG